MNSLEFIEQPKKKFVVGIYDDQAVYYKNLLSEKLDCEVVIVNERNLKMIDFYAKQISDEEKLKEYVSGKIGDVLIIDGTYKVNNKTAIDVRNSLLSTLPDYIDRCCFMIGTDVLQYMNKYSNEYKRLMNINYTPYTNKMQTMLDFIKEKASSFGSVLTEYDVRDVNTTPSFLDKLNEYIDLKTEYAEELSAFEAFKYITEAKPLGFQEDRIGMYLEKHFLNNVEFRHLLGQTIGYKNIVFNLFKSAENDEIREGLKQTIEHEDHFVLVNKKCQSEEKNVSVKFISSSTSLQDFVSKTFSGIGFMQMDRINSAIAKFLGKENEFLVFNPSNKFEFEETLKIKEALLQKNPDLKCRIKVMVDEKLANEIGGVSDEIQVYSDLNQELCNNIIEYANNNGLYLIKKDTNGLVRREYIEAINGTVNVIDRGRMDLRDLYNKGEELFKLGAISITESKILAQIDKEMLNMIYYMHISGQISASLQTIRDSIPEEYIIDEPIRKISVETNNDTDEDFQDSVSGKVLANGESKNAM